MADSPTIVIAQLSDDALKQSIKALTDSVNDAVNGMATNFDRKIGDMESKLQSLGKSKGGSGSTITIDTSQAIESQKKLKKEVDSTAMSYDQLEHGKQRAIKPSSAEDSYYTIIKNMRENVALLAMEIKNMPSASLDKQFGVYMQYENQIKQVRQRIAELNRDLQNMGKDPNSSRLVIKQTMDEIASQQQKITQLEREQIQTIQQIEVADKQMLAAKQQQYETERRELSGLVVGERERVSFQDSQIKNEQNITKEIKKQAQAIRESKEWKEQGFVRIGDKSYYDPERSTGTASERKKLLSLEEQLLKVQQEEAQQAEILARAKQIQADAATKAVHSEQQLLDAAEKRYAFTNKEMLEWQNKNYQATKKNGRAGSVSEYTELEHVVANLLNIEVQELNLASNLHGSYNALRGKLSQLTDAYHEMTASERKSAQGKELADKIQKTGKAISDIQKQMNRPISLDKILGFNPKTIDDITWKIQQLNSYKRGIVLTDTNAKSEIEQVDRAIAQLNKDLNKYMSQGKSVLETNNALGRSWNYMKNRLAFYLTVGASTAFVKNLIEVRSQYELLERSIGILIDDARKGSQIFNELNAMAIKSPFTTMELGAAAKQLVAFNIAADDVVGTTKRIADMAAAVGIPMERLTYALGQVKAYGYLNSRDARIFLNAGIPIVQMLTDMYNKQRDVNDELITASQVRDMMTKRLISYSDVMKVVNDATDEGGRFFNFQEKAAGTLKIQLANLTLAYNNMLNEMGKDSQGIISTSIKGLSVLYRNWRSLSSIISTSIVAMGAYKTIAALTAVKNGRLVTAGVLRALVLWVTNIRRASGAMAVFNAIAAKNPFLFFGTILASAIAYFGLFRDSLGDTGRNLQELTKSFDEFDKQLSDIYAKAMTAKTFSEQIEELRNLINKAQTELGITIPVNLEDVNESNIKTKIKEIKDRIDEYLAFTETFATAATKKELSKPFDDFGAAANTILNDIINNLGLVKEGLINAGKTAKDIDLLDKQDGESTIEYLQRIIALYEEMGLLGRKKVVTDITQIFSPQSSFGSHLSLSRTKTNMPELIEAQSKALKELGITNKAVFRSMMADVQYYYANLSKANTSFERFSKELAQKLDVKKIIENNKQQATIKIEAAIDKYATENSISSTAVELMKDLANKKWGITIQVGTDAQSKKKAEEDLLEWQRKLQKQANKEGIKLKVGFTTEQTEAGYASEALTKYKEALENIEVQRKKVSAGTATKEDIDRAIERAKEFRETARLAGSDLDSINKKSGAKKDTLGDALAKEVQIITDIQKRYKEYQQVGVKANEALAKAAKEYNKTLEEQNKVISAAGIKTLTFEQLATMPLQKIRDFYEEQLKGAKGSKKAVEALEKALASINVEITKIDYKRITDGLNNELSKLKDEYELAVELDANPELGGMFADMFGIDTKTLPKTFGEMYDRANAIAKEKIQKLKVDTEKFDLLSTKITPDKDGKWMGIDVSSEPIKELTKAQESLRAILKKNLTEAENNLDAYVKKYGDYSDKIEEIEADRLGKLKKLNDTYYTEEMRHLPEYISKRRAIEQGAVREAGAVRFDDFKNSKYYVAMFENIEFAATATLKGIRTQLDELKGSLSDLSPEQLKWVVEQIEKLDKELLSRNPFKNLGENIKNYLNAAGSVGKKTQEEFKNAQRNVNQQKKIVAALKSVLELKKRGVDLDAKQLKHVSETSGLKLEEINSNIDINKVNSQTVEEINEQITAAEGLLVVLKEILESTEKENQKFNLAKKILKEQGIAIANVVSSNLQSLGGLRDFLQDDLGIQLSDSLNGLVDGLSTMGSGIQSIVSSATSGDVVGVLAGVGKTVYGIYDGIASIFGGGSAADRKITRQIEDSVSEVNRLERSVSALKNAYDALSDSAERAYGTQKTGAELAANATKKAQLQLYELQQIELKRQLQLEESRSSKKRDQDRINSLKSEIISLQGTIDGIVRDVANAVADITDEMLGLSRASWAEELTSSLIGAFKAGEDYMGVFESSWDDMVDNMIMKLIVSRLIGDYMDKYVFGKIDELVGSRTEDYSNQLSNIESQIQRVKSGEWDATTLSDSELSTLMQRLGVNKLATDVLLRMKNGIAVSMEEYAVLLKAIEGKNISAEYIKMLEEYAAAVTQSMSIAVEQATADAYQKVLNDPSVKAGASALVEQLPQFLEQFGITYGQDSDKQLSALQQGIQGITEQTAGALEATTTGMYQQVCLQSDILQQINTALQTFDLDIQMATLSHILLQLQSSYQIQQSILTTMEGWSNPSGSAVKVELIS